MISYPRPSTRLAVGLLAAALLLGCNSYKQPASEAPHAVVVGTYLGGEPNPQTGYIAFGYTPGVTVCKGRKAGQDCKKFVSGTLDGRELRFRVAVDKEITISPVALVASSYKNDGVTATTSRTYCYGVPFTITPKAGERYNYGYLYDPEKQGCGSTWEKVTGTE